jgi:hypothetical protein
MQILVTHQPTILMGPEWLADKSRCMWGENENEDKAIFLTPCTCQCSWRKHLQFSMYKGLYRK